MAVTPSGTVTVPEVAVQRSRVLSSMINMELSGFWVGVGSWSPGVPWSPVLPPVVSPVSPSSCSPWSPAP